MRRAYLPHERTDVNPIIQCGIVRWTTGGAYDPHAILHLSMVVCCLLIRMADIMTIATIWMWAIIIVNLHCPSTDHFLHNYPC